MHPLVPVPAQALFLAGLRLEEVAVTREIMDALGAAEVKVLLLYSEEVASHSMMVATHAGNQALTSSAACADPGRANDRRNAAHAAGRSPGNARAPVGAAAHA
jgi:hypothetical protein